MQVGKNYNFDELAEMWFQNHKHRITKATQDSYGYTLRALTNYFGERKIKDITAPDVEEMLRVMKAEGRSSSYLSSCRGMLYQIMDLAMDSGLIVYNPVRCADKMKHSPSAKREAFTPAEVDILMEKLPQNRIGWSIRLLLNTGMRPQELLALEPRHIAHDGSSVCVEQAVKMEKGTAVVGVPANENSYRTIPVPSHVQYCAVALRSTDLKYIWEERKKDHPCNPTYFRDRFKEALDSIEGVRTLLPYSCRYTYIHQMLTQGTDLKTIMKLTGHSTHELRVDRIF